MQIRKHELGDCLTPIHETMLVLASMRAYITVVGHRGLCTRSTSRLAAAALLELLHHVNEREFQATGKISNQAPSIGQELGARLLFARNITPDPITISNDPPKMLRQEKAARVLMSRAENKCLSFGEVNVTGLPLPLLPLRGSLFRLEGFKPLSSGVGVLFAGWLAAVFFPVSIKLGTVATKGKDRDDEGKRR